MKRSIFMCKDNIEIVLLKQKFCSSGIKSKCLCEGLYHGSMAFSRGRAPCYSLWSLLVIFQEQVPLILWNKAFRQTAKTPLSIAGLIRTDLEKAAIRIDHLMNRGSSRLGFRLSTLHDKGFDGSIKSRDAYSQRTVQWAHRFRVGDDLHGISKNSTPCPDLICMKIDEGRPR